MPSLAGFPFVGRRFGDTYRVIVSGRYLIFYRVNEAADRIVIVAILHGARHYDLDGLILRDQPDEN